MASKTATNPSHGPLEARLREGALSRVNSRIGLPEDRLFTNPVFPLGRASIQLDTSLGGDYWVLSERMARSLDNFSVLFPAIADKNPRWSAVVAKGFCSAYDSLGEFVESRVTFMRRLDYYAISDGTFGRANFVNEVAINKFVQLLSGYSERIAPLLDEGHPKHEYTVANLVAISATLESEAREVPLFAERTLLIGALRNRASRIERLAWFGRRG